MSDETKKKYDVRFDPVIKARSVEGKIDAMLNNSNYNDAKGFKPMINAKLLMAFLVESGFTAKAIQMPNSKCTNTGQTFPHAKVMVYNLTKVQEDNVFDLIKYFNDLYSTSEDYCVFEQKLDAAKPFVGSNPKAASPVAQVPVAPAARPVSRSVPFASLAASAPAPAPALAPAPVPAPPETPSQKLERLQAQANIINQQRAELAKKQEALTQQQEELAASISAAKQAAKAESAELLRKLRVNLSDEEWKAIVSAAQDSHLSAPAASAPAPVPAWGDQPAD